MATKYTHLLKTKPSKTVKLFLYYQVHKSVFLLDKLCDRSINSCCLHINSLIRSSGFETTIKNNSS